MKKVLLLSVVLLGSGLAVFAGGQNEPMDEDVYPAGTMSFMGYGNPQVHKVHADDFLNRNRDVAPTVDFEILHVESESAARQHVIMSVTAGAWDDLPTAMRTEEVSLQVMADHGILVDLTDFALEHKDDYIDGVWDAGFYDGRYYGIPTQFKPQLLFYNATLFEKYNIDPERMDTIEGWIDVGRDLKRKSEGKVRLSYIDPGHFTWRYYGRRGLMPQAEANIWDDDGNVVIDTDPGSLLAFNTLDTLKSEDLLLTASMFQPQLYDATRDGRIATFYIGAFWDQFLRQNLPDMEGDWRMMPAPMFENIGLRGAPVAAIDVILNPPGGAPYKDLYLEMMLDFQFNNEARIDWTEKMIGQNQTVSAPIVKKTLEDPYWSQPTHYYGGQSLLGMETKGLVNFAPNLRVTNVDAEADSIISAELEKYVAGDQSMDQAVANMGRILRQRIRKAPAAR
ncbi:carbohydrate ABC transporter substrate-binding protein, CUT1 family [Alkalispirochaeta americana]|uniref:Carbohydrate ABC transporter substrate-binding protein, CUT1 family n=1 Tax=Alkalispirochaeta americana TaxID=159291 RepID=A0A1N6XXG1_9SPIO|nr:extracellular solute-binding protein [Alkalispirochaeta americana]SIR06923.1 carbohydrate ABC transporter substrate-binding protein, CUT1 family [Alkalispirochaeta americana]